MFNGIWLVAMEPMTVNGRDLKMGDYFEYPRVLAGALLVMKRATVLRPVPIELLLQDDNPAPPPPTRRRRKQTPKPDETPAPETPEQPAVTDPITETPQQPELNTAPRRRYQRRDLEAEP